MKNARPYTPPPGYYDLPYTYAFDASGLTNGNNYPNQQVYIQGGYGDFAVRRVVGLNRILNPNSTGQFQLMRASQGVYRSSNPIQAENSPEIATVPEEWYPETGQIGFDLYGTLLPAQPLTGQLAFQGVRRLPGTRPGANYKRDPKSFTYQTSAILTRVAPSTPVTTYTPINNYDFELHNIIIMKSSSVSIFVIVGDGDIGFIGFGSKVAGVNIVIVPNFSGTPNVAPTLVVAGLKITFTQGTDALGAPLLGITNTAMSALIAATPAADALIATQSHGGNFDYTPSQPGSFPPGIAVGINNNFTFLVATISSGAGLTPITSPICALSVYDHNFVTLSNMPIMDIFYNGGPGSPYVNGAVVPPLFYRKDSQLQIDFYSEVTDPSLLPVEIVVYLVGKKLYPCQ